jgi:hypothetical protein
MAGEVPPVSSGHSRKGIYVLFAWILLLQCAFTGLQWQSIFFGKQQHVQEQQQPAALASPSDKYYKPMAGGFGNCSSMASHSPTCFKHDAPAVTVICYCLLTNKYARAYTCLYVSCRPSAAAWLPSRGALCDHC